MSLVRTPSRRNLAILMAIMMATFMFVMIPRAEVCAERVEEVLDTEPSVVPPAQPVADPVPMHRDPLAGPERVEEGDPVD